MTHKDGDKFWSCMSATVKREGEPDQNFVLRVYGKVNGTTRETFTSYDTPTLARKNFYDFIKAKKMRGYLPPGPSKTFFDLTSDSVDDHMLARISEGSPSDTATLARRLAYKFKIPCRVTSVQPEQPVQYKQTKAPVKEEPSFSSANYGENFGGFA
jgi:predicted DNA-binding WGR domain protein